MKGRCNLLVFAAAVSFLGGCASAPKSAKSLRGLNAYETVPAIIPLLNNPKPEIVRDACRTLAVLGDRSTIQFIAPLLQSSDVAVKADAEDAVFQLKSKPPDTRRAKQASL